MSGADQRLEYLRSIAEKNVIPYPSPYKINKGMPQPAKKRNNRRHKAARQLISDEMKRINAELEPPVQHTENVGGSSDDNISSKKKIPKVTYFNVNAPPSIKPTKKYCDITGLKSNYQSPTNNIRYHNSEIYQLIVKPMAPGVDQEYLKLRGANFVLK